MHRQIYIRLKKTSLWGSSEYTERSMRHWMNVGTGCVLSTTSSSVLDSKLILKISTWLWLRVLNPHSEVLLITSMTSSTCLCRQSRQSCPASVQSIWGSRKDYLYDIVNTVSTRRGTARNATEDNSAAGQTVTVSGTKEVEMSMRRKRAKQLIATWSLRTRFH